MSATRREYRKLTEEEIANIDVVKRIGDEFIDYLDSYVLQGRERAIAITKMEEAVMWAVKGITA